MNLKDAVFTGIGSSDGKLLKANFRNANLSGAYLNNLDLSDLNFTNCDLSDARLTGSRAIGTDFTGANLQGAYLNVGVNFIRTKFISADMRGLKGFKSSTDVDFSYADMSGFNLSNMGMSSIIFGKSTSGTGCLFHKTNLTGANTSGSGTSFASSQLDGAIMTNGNFSSNNFQSSSLVKNSDIANFSGSNFNSANFSGVGTISFVIVNSSTNYGNTIWHNGFKCSSTSNQGLCKDSNDNTIP